jgi:RNA polymerase sigma-70 factor, ECF subfamily
MMPAPIQAPAAYQRRRPGVASYRDGAAMPDQSSLIEAHIPGLRRFACALMRGDRQSADDLVQDCLERALSRWHLRRAEGDVRGWLYTILYNRFLSEKNRQARRGAPDALQEVAEAEMPGVDGGQNWALEHRDLLRAFAALPEEQRSVVVLIGVEDLSYLQAARVLGVPIGTVMSRLSRGRERLRHYMNGDANIDRRRRDAELRRVK